MALTTEQIDLAIQQHVDPVATYGRLHNFARAIEAEVRKQDNALIQQMLEALEYAYRPLCMCFAGCDNCDPTKEIPDAQAAIAAARARLGEKT